MSAIFARTSASPSARSSAGLRRDAVFRSRALACIAARSSSVQTFAALLPLARLVVVFVSVICQSFRGSSGGRRGDGLRLEDSDRVAERIPETHVRAVEMVHRLLGEVRHAALLERLEQSPGVVRVEDETAHRTLRDQLADLLGGRVVMQGRARLLEGDLDGLLAGDADRDPAIRAL